MLKIESQNFTLQVNARDERAPLIVFCFIVNQIWRFRAAILYFSMLKLPTRVMTNTAPKKGNFLPFGQLGKKRFSLVVYTESSRRIRRGVFLRAWPPAGCCRGDAW